MKYNTDINAFGGIQDYHMVHEALRSYANGEMDLKKRMIQDNVFGIRTEEGRGRFYRGIKSSILTFQNDDHQRIYNSFFNELDTRFPYNLLVFWQLVINNKLFQILTRDLYLKFYFQGKATITGQDVLFFIADLKERDQEFKDLNWTPKSIGPVASKYLTVLRKLGLVDGTQKKVIKHIQISDNEFTTFLYLLSTLYPRNENLLKNDFQIFSFVSPESFPERVKKVAKKGLIGMSYTGTKLTIEPIIDYNNLADGIYRRA
ncbi:BrxA family protein [Algoriphagus sp. SE2]|uniref:BrxA family protein n=1 Tax=Algoriphagus sp. SE2 TaxID=3141536 RepID=UPI0031CD3315